MTDDTDAFKLDLPRILRIKDQADRGEELSAEDVAYVRECIVTIAAVLRPAVDAFGKALAEFARRVSELSKPATRAINVTTNGPAPSAADLRRVRDQVASKDRRYYR